MDPQQELFSELLVQLRETEYDVYDSMLPSEGTQYPFLYLADNHQTDTTTKSAVIGRVYQTIHVWHNNPRQRGAVSGMLLAAKQVCRKLKHTENFSWALRNADQQIRPDNTTKQPLLHGILEVEYEFS